MTASKLIKEMHVKNVDFRNFNIVGSSSWTFFTAPLKPIASILKNAKSVLVPDVIDHIKLKKTDFYKRFRKRYNEDPLGVQAISYDVTRMVVQCLKINRYKVLECLRARPYNGVTGIIKYAKDDPFPERNIFFTSIVERLE